MFIINIAGINIRVLNRYEGLKRFCVDYITEAEPDFEVCVTPESIENEISATRETVSAAYAESACVYREICKRLPEYGAFLLHSAVVERDGEAYAFSAPSGTGKSTHVSMWLSAFGDKARIINGDKPIIRFSDDGRAYVYGTPWCGKEGQNINTCAPLRAICFIERGTDNNIRHAQSRETVGRLMRQILLPHTKDMLALLMPLLDKCVREIPCYVLTCNISPEAAEVAYNAMRPEVVTGGKE